MRGTKKQVSKANSAFVLMPPFWESLLRAIPLSPPINLHCPVLSRH